MRKKTQRRAQRRRYQRFSSKTSPAMSTSLALNTFKVRNGGFGVCRWWSSEHEPLSRVRSTGAKEEPRSELVQKKSGCPGQQKQAVSRTGGDGSITANDSVRRRSRERKRRMIQRGTADVDDQPPTSQGNGSRFSSQSKDGDGRRRRLRTIQAVFSLCPDKHHASSSIPLRVCGSAWLGWNVGPLSEAALDVDDDVA
jgi:hypothetical protein